MTEISRVDELRAALEAMAFQFGQRANTTEGPKLGTGGLSALEQAFDVLGWEDPRDVDGELACDIEGCLRWSESGLWWGDLYLRLCGTHTSECFKKAERPAVKKVALDREARRGPDRVLR